jgi:ribosome-binding protein aMBF1 (putative translation factor)
VRFARTFPRPEPLKYPKNLKTIGDHIRKRRMDKGLSQSKLGQIFTVSKDCVTNWENGRNTPQIGFYPRIISFLGYYPFLGDKSTLGNAIFAYRCEKGISAKSLGTAIGIGGCTVLAIEQYRCIPQKDTLRKIGAIIQYKL